MRLAQASIRFCFRLTKSCRAATVLTLPVSLFVCSKTAARLLSMGLARSLNLRSRPEKAALEVATAGRQTSSWQM